MLLIFAVISVCTTEVSVLMAFDYLNVKIVELNLDLVEGLRE